MRRAAAVSSLTGVILLVAATGSAAALGALHGAARASAQSSSTTLPARVPAASPIAVEASGGGEDYTGSAEGHVDDTGTVTDASDGLSLATTSTIAGRLQFEFLIRPGPTLTGLISGFGFGEFTEATYSADGSWEKGPISSCEVPVTALPFKVGVSGQAILSPHQFGQIDEYWLNLKLEDAEETNPDTECGSGFSIYNTTSTILAQSLSEAIAKSPQPALAFDEPVLTFTEGSTIDYPHVLVPYDNGHGTVGTDDDTWVVAIQPSIGWKLEFKALLEAAAQVASVNGNIGAMAQACSAVPEVFQSDCAIFVTSYTSAQAALAVTLGTVSADPVDSHYRSVARPLAGHTPHVRSVRGLSVAEAAALNAQLTAKARTAALASALARAVDRYSGAAIAKNTKWKREQRAAARRYAGQLAASLASELTDAKRAQHAAAHTPLSTLRVNAAAIRAYEANVKAHGVSQAVAADLASLKLPPGDLPGIRGELERTSPATLAKPFSLLTALDFPSQERDTRSAIQALRVIARSGK